MKNLIVYIVSAMSLLTACDALDITPSDSYSDPVVWQDQNLIKMFVNDQYGALVGQVTFIVIHSFQTRYIKNTTMKDAIMFAKIF